MKSKSFVVTLIVAATAGLFASGQNCSVQAQPGSIKHAVKATESFHSPAGSKRCFEPSQVWSYKTRPQDNGSTFTVIKIDEKAGKKIVSVRVEGLHLKNPTSPGGMANAIGHVPMDAVALGKCSTSLLHGGAVIPADSNNGYEAWHSAFTSGNAGAFTIPLAEVVQTLEKTMNAPVKGNSK